MEIKSREDDSIEVEPEEQAQDESNNTDVWRSLHQIITPSCHSDYVMTTHDAYCILT
jgi:hypothetical protein